MVIFFSGQPGNVMASHWGDAKSLAESESRMTDEEAAQLATLNAAQKQEFYQNCRGLG